MNNSAPSPSAKSYAERIAWMHEPVHLRCGFLPWFVRRMLEDALHRYFCRFEQVLLAMMELYQQGKLEPWPDAAEAATAPRKSKYKMKFPPAAPARGAGCSAAPLPPQMPSGSALVQDTADNAAEVETDDRRITAPGFARPSFARIAMAPLATAPCGTVTMARPHPPSRPPWGRFWGADNRCIKLKTFKPVWAQRENCV